MTGCKCKKSIHKKEGCCKIKYYKFEEINNLKIVIDDIEEEEKDVKKIVYDNKKCKFIFN